MPRRIGIAVLLLAIGVVIGVTLRPNIAADPPKGQKEKPIPIDEVRKRGILGDLGHPLGTIVTIEGKVEKYDGLKHGKALEGETLLRVNSVNDTELNAPPLFVYERDFDKPKVGDKFKYRGYETGRFEGLVRDKDEPAVAGVRYGFVRHFVIKKDELKPEKK